LETGIFGHGMQKTINKYNLKVGMCVILPVTWYRYPFVKDQFLIKSTEQIEKISETGVTEIVLDIKINRLDVNQNTIDPQKTEAEKNRKTTRTKNLYTQLAPEAIHGANLPPRERAKAVRTHSITIISSLLENPAAENIRDVKKGIAEVVDLILTDNDTTLYLLNITSHDFYTYMHSANAGFWRFLPSHSSENQRITTCTNWGAGFFLNYLGKMEADASIISKPGKLTEEEMAQMRHHPHMGYKLL